MDNRIDGIVTPEGFDIIMRLVKVCTDRNAWNANETKAVDDGKHGYFRVEWEEYWENKWRYECICSDDSGHADDAIDIMPFCIGEETVVLLVAGESLQECSAKVCECNFDLFRDDNCNGEGGEAGVSPKTLNENLS